MYRITFTDGTAWDIDAAAVAYLIETYGLPDDHAGDVLRWHHEAFAIDAPADCRSRMADVGAHHGKGEA